MRNQALNFHEVKEEEDEFFPEESAPDRIIVVAQSTCGSEHQMKSRNGSDIDSNIPPPSPPPCRNYNHQWTPTLRRISLLNTLLFLGLALSSTKLNAHASSIHVMDTQSTSSSSSASSAMHRKTQHKEDAESSSLVVNSEKVVVVESESSNGETDGASLTGLLEVIDDDDVTPDDPVEDDDPSQASSNSDTTIDGGVIIVVTVDGTLAAIEGSTGKVLWKQPGKGSRNNNKGKKGSNRDGSNNDDGMKIPEGQSSRSRLLNPLTETTTTAGSASDSTSVMAAIPSINGNVFLTTIPNSPSDPKARPNNNIIPRTETASLQGLVARAPYVDSGGNFFVGSRHTTAAAIDSETGEILYVASANGNDEDGGMNVDPEWEGRNVVWIGRVDYAVSVYNGKSKEVRFSASEIMSVNDMLAEKQDPKASSSSSTQAPVVPPEDELFRRSLVFDDDENQHKGRPFSALVATPSGNLAYRNQNTGRVEWVADEAFETPPAYAIHSSSGHSLSVDIIPDVTMPSHSKEYLTREIERQIELTLDGDNDSVSAEGRKPADCRSIQDGETVQPSIVGTLMNGQLYAMPLGRRHQSTSQSKIRTQQQHMALDLAAVQRHHFAASTNSLSSLQEKPILGNKMPLHVGRLPKSQDDRQLSATTRACGPSSPVFPGCLFKAVSRRVAGSLSIVASLKQKKRPASDGTQDDAVEQHAHLADVAAVESLIYQQPEQETPYYDTHYHSFQQHQHRQRNYRKMLKILGSWLPPTIALLFVVSFELGRRKRQKDGLDVLKQVTDGKAVEANELLRSVDQGGNVSSDSGPRQMIQVTDEVLGFGGHGTVVFKGTLEGRNVAVKRMLKTYLASADREISLLIESDGHPNVVRYFLKEVKDEFVFLALELCDLSLHNLIGTLVAMPKAGEGEVSQAARRLLLQIASGVKHLHSLRIVHNDLKPANILLALSKEAKSATRGGSNESIYNTFQKSWYVAKISDMGLGRLLAGQSSFGASASFRGQSGTINSNGNVGMGPGTVGWMAPEAMRMKSTPSLSSDASNSGEASSLDKAESTSTRASRSVDIFSLGCIFYSTLVPGLHPFGEWYEREANIMHNRPCIEPLKKVAVEAYDLVSAMIQHNPRSRPTAKQICEHPFFWSFQTKLSFICDLSDRLETDSASPDSTVSKGSSSFAAHPLAIERNAAQVVGLAWDKVLYKGLTEQRYRTYDPSSVRDLLRLLRNKKSHFNDLETYVRQKIGSDTDGLMKYFESCFPHLLMHCYRVCCEILPPDDPLVDKYSLLHGMNPTSYAFVSSTKSLRKVPPPLVEEPQFASQDDLSQGETTRPPAKTEGGQTKTYHAANPCESVTLASQKPMDRVDDSTTGPKAGPTTSASAQQKSGQSVAPAGILSQEEEKAIATGSDEILQDDIVIWGGSTAARTLKCRGWMRGDEEWMSRSSGVRKRNAALVRCAEDSKFRTRLCNHWDTSMGTSCPMRRKNKCVFAHGPVELRLKEGKKGRWGKLVDKNGNNSNLRSSGGEDTYGAARSIESARKEEGKWSTRKGANGGKKQNANKKKSRVPSVTS